AIAKAANPKIQILRARPRICSALGSMFDGIVTSERFPNCFGARDAVGFLALWIFRGESKLDLRIGHNPLPWVGHILLVRIARAVIAIQSHDLASDLRNGNILFV